MADRRQFLTRFAATASTLLLSGCYDLSQTEWWPKVLGSAETVTKGAQRLFAGRWALAQEFILQSFFFTRCEELFGSATAVWVTATFFAAVHLPNMVLTTFTLTAGLFFCEMFRRYRSIYLLGIVHAVLGLTLSTTIPPSLLFHLRVGIGFLR